MVSSKKDNRDNVVAPGIVNNDADQVPVEIDTHLQLYGKRAWEVQFGEKCAICDKRIDEFGFCACGSTQ